METNKTQYGSRGKGTSRSRWLEDLFKKIDSELDSTETAEKKA